MNSIRSGVTAAVLALAAAGLCLVAGSANAAPFPVITDAPTAIATRYLSPASESPAGANRFGCRDRDGRNNVRRNPLSSSPPHPSGVPFTIN